MLDAVRPDAGNNIGEGYVAYKADGDVYGAHFYRDRTGSRLVLFDGPYGGIDEAILSRISRHPAKLVKRNLSDLRTGPGVGLGDTERQVLDNMGSPSESDHYHGYHILWYLSEPEDDRGHKAGDAKAIALSRGHVVEIWLESWSTAPVP